MKLNELLEYDNIVIQCHNFPDADAVASRFGVYSYLCLRGKKPRLIYSGSQKISKPNMLLMIEKLEIPIEYVEVVINKYSNCVNRLESHIKGCVAVNEAIVKAKKLTRRVKVFTEWDKNNYLSGSVGDYLAAKADNPKDVYIIKNKLFDKLYIKA